ncbi:MAG: hypothetical protein WAV21_00645 [Minisyncoccia bacterium]
MNTSYQKIVVGILLLVVAGIGVYRYLTTHQYTPQMVACTEEAKMCPDGSAVGRTGPNCEFAECPKSEIPAWELFTDETQKISFKYPKELGTTYLHEVDWPPKVSIEKGSFTCTEAGTPTARAGKTEQKIINGHVYCLTTESEGAAGSTYVQYAYALAKDDTVAIFTFSLRFVQCANYDEPQKTTCEHERETFSVDGLIDQIASTLVIALKPIPV